MSHKFRLDLVEKNQEEKDWFAIEKTTEIGIVSLKGTTGVMLAHAFHLFMNLISSIL